MTETAKKVADDARRLGVKAGDVLLVHSSFKSLGAPEASPADLIDGLIKALDGGTLVMPALSYMHCNPGQRALFILRSVVRDLNDGVDSDESVFLSDPAVVPAEIYYPRIRASRWVRARMR